MHGWGHLCSYLQQSIRVSIGCLPAALFTVLITSFASYPLGHSKFTQIYITLSILECLGQPISINRSIIRSILGSQIKCNLSHKTEIPTENFQITKFRNMLILPHDLLLCIYIAYVYIGKLKKSKVTFVLFITCRIESSVSARYEKIGISLSAVATVKLLLVITTLPLQENNML